MHTLQCYSTLLNYFHVYTYTHELSYLSCNILTCILHCTYTGPACGDNAQGADRLFRPPQGQGRVYT